MFFIKPSQEGSLFVQAETGCIVWSDKNEAYLRKQGIRYQVCLDPAEAIRAFSDCFRCPFYELINCAPLHDRPFCTLSEEWIDSGLKRIYLCAGNWNNCPQLKKKGLI